MILLSLLLTLILYFVYIFIGIAHLLFYQSKRIKKVIEGKRRERQQLIHKHQGADLDDEPITKLGLMELAKAIRNGRYSAERVLLAYCRAAARAQQSRNCLTEVMFDSGLEAARKADMEQREGSSVLHGVPISIKDHLQVAGFDTACGICKLAYNPATKDAVIVRALKESGAIPFIKTNVPQTMMSFECSNPLWGQTDNPRKAGHTPGGSSGGEAALIACGGSPAGIGSDIAGSLRLPAAFCGIVAFKPTPGMVSNCGGRSIRPAQPFGLLVTNGPMGRNVSDVALLYDLIRAPSAPDTIPACLVPPKSGSRSLRFWMWYEDGFSPLSPACRRALQETRDRLRLAGHTVVELSEPPFETIELVRILHALISADGGECYLRALGGEGVDRCLWPFAIKLALPGFLQSLIRLIGWTLSKDPRYSALWESSYTKSAAEALEWEGRRVTIVRKTFERIWHCSNAPDLLLCAPFSLPAPLHGSFPDTHWSASYCFVWNLLHYPAGVVPVGKVQPELDHYDQTSATSLFDRSIMRHYDAVEMADLPLAVQVVGPPFSDSLVLHGMKVIEALTE